MTHRSDLVVLNLRTRRLEELTATAGMSDEQPRWYRPTARPSAYHAYDTARLFNDQGHLRMVDRRTGAWTPSAGAPMRGRPACSGVPTAARSCSSARIGVGSGCIGLPLGAEPPIP